MHNGGGYSGVGDWPAEAVLDYIRRLNVPEDVRWWAWYFYFYMPEVAIDIMVQALQSYARHHNIPFNHVYAEEVTEEMQPASEVVPDADDVLAEVRAYAETHQAYDPNDDATPATEESSSDDEADLAARSIVEWEYWDYRFRYPGSMVEDVEEEEWSEEEL